MQCSGRREPVVGADEGYLNERPNSYNRIPEENISYRDIILDNRRRLWTLLYITNAGTARPDSRIH